PVAERLGLTADPRERGRLKVGVAIELERPAGGRVAGLLQLGLDVGGRGLVAGAAGRAVAVVLGCDRVEGEQVGADRLGGDRLAELEGADRLARIVVGVGLGLGLGRIALVVGLARIGVVVGLARRAGLSRRAALAPIRLGARVGSGRGRAIIGAGEHEQRERAEQRKRATHDASVPIFAHKDSGARASGGNPTGSGDSASSTTGSALRSKPRRPEAPMVVSANHASWPTISSAPPTLCRSSTAATSSGSGPSRSTRSSTKPEKSAFEALTHGRPSTAKSKPDSCRRS